MKNNTWRRLLAALIVCMMMVSGLNMLCRTKTIRRNTSEELETL